MGRRGRRSVEWRRGRRRAARLRISVRQTCLPDFSALEIILTTGKGESCAGMKQFTQQDPKCLLGKYGLLPYPLSP